MTKLIKNPVLAVIFLLMVSMPPLYAAGKPSVKIIIDAPDGNKIEVNETFHITIEAVNCAGSIDLRQLPPGVKKVYDTTRQTVKMATHNGVSESVSSTSLILTCKGETPGKYSFGPVSVNGVKSNVISYQVVPSSGTKQRGGNSNNSSNSSSSNGLPSFDPKGSPLFVGKGNEEIYLRAFVNRSTAYEQEAIEYTVKLYTTYDYIKFLGAAAAPKFDGFVVEESQDVSTSFKFEDVGGKTFKTAVIARYIIFPQKAGELKVTGNTYTVSTDARQYYHDPYFQTITVKQPIQLNVTPNDIEINVKALPTPIPDNFIGGVGNFTLSSSLPQNQLTTNAAATLKYEIKGEGNLNYLKLPELSTFLPKSFEIYSPEIKTDSRVESSTVKGTVTFDYSLIPRETGTFEIPSITFYYFDPADSQYKPLRSSSYRVDVTAGHSSAKSQQTLSFNPKLMPAGPMSVKAGEPYVYSFFYWLWYIVPVMIFITALVGYRKYVKDRDDMVVFRSKNANKMALKRLAKAYKCLKNKQESQFYDEMLAALWGYLADKLKIPTSKLNRGNVGDEFKQHGVSESTFMPIINLIDECEYAKYTPVARNDNMHQLYAQAIESLSKVESEYEEKTQEKGKGDDDEEEDTQTGN